MIWRVKGLIQKTLSVLPGGRTLNRVLQHSVGSLRSFDRESDGKIEDFRLLAQQLTLVGTPIAGATFFEIGSGWYPTLPICLYLVGARRVITVDLVRHLDLSLALRLVRKLAGEVDSIAHAAGVDARAVGERRALLEAKLAGGAMLDIATDGGIDYRAPADAASTGLPAESVDVAYSNSVLEHIPPAVLDAIFSESRRILKRGGLMFHSVNCGDHYAYTDGQIGQLHYLQFSARQWELLWNNDIQYQNRLRAVEFVKLAHQHAFEIIRDTTKVLPERLDELRALPRIAPEFSRYTPEELCVTTIDFIGKKGA